MKTFTVVGLYEDNKQVYVGHVYTENVESAVREAKAEMSKNTHGTSQGAVLAVFADALLDLYGENELYEE